MEEIWLDGHHRKIDGFSEWQCVHMPAVPRETKIDIDNLNVHSVKKAFNLHITWGHGL